MTSRKILDVDFNTLAYERAFNIIPSQSPDVSLRLCIPVPNWLNGEGYVLKRFDHPDIVEHEGAWHFRFRNERDKFDQYVKIDGTGAVVMDGALPKHWDELYGYVLTKTHGGINALNGEELAALMKWMSVHSRVRNTRMRAGDFDASTVRDVQAAMYPQQAPKRGSVFGAFLPRPNLSAAIGYQGPVRFHMPDGHAQTYKDEKGGFVVFPALSAAEVKLAGRDGIFALCAEREVTPHTAAPKALAEQNTLPDHSPIPRPTFRPWFRVRKLG